MPDWGQLRTQQNAQATTDTNSGGYSWGDFAKEVGTASADPTAEGVQTGADQFEDVAGPQSPQSTSKSLGLGAPSAEGGGGMGLGTVLGAAALGAGALALHRPDLAENVAGKVAKGVAVARMTSMLSGLAPLKSIIGNLGAPIIESAERGTLDPIREFASAQTVKDWLRAFHTGDTGLIQGSSSKLNIPGRIMGAGDYATQQALQRAGLDRTEAMRAVLQLPLGQSFGKMGQALEGPVAEVMVPFRRTPFNQFYEGFKSMTPSHPHKAVTAAATAAGAVSGAASSKEQYPVLPGLVTAAATKYGVPAAIGAFLGRELMKGSGGGGIVGSVLPVSEYGIEESIRNPLTPLMPSKLGIVRAYERLFGQK